MDYRLMGQTGVRIAPLALGTFNFGTRTPPSAAEQMLLRALDAGINLVDTANSYGGGESERIIGDILQRSGRRREVVLATKVHYPVAAPGKSRPGPNDSGNSRLHIVQACEDSLRRLQTDHIDLYQIHRPDPTVPVEETLKALTDLVRQGKVRYVGCSTHPAWHVMEALLVAELKGTVCYISEQPPYNLLDRRIENELIPLAQRYNLAIFPWAPLAMGVLAGRYENTATESSTDITLPSDSRAATIGGIYAERVTARGIQIGNDFAAIAREADITPAQLAVLWAKDQPAVTAPLIGPRTVEQLDELMPVLDMTLGDDLRAACDRLVPPGSAVVDFHNTAPWMKMRI